MKLRNKKTGEIWDIGKVLSNDYPCWETLAQLCEEWEGYKSTEPLIKDPKSRKVFQEWADLFGAEQFRVNHFSDSRRKTTSIGSTDSVTEPVIELPGHIGEDSKDRKKGFCPDNQGCC